MHGIKVYGYTFMSFCHFTEGTSFFDSPVALLDDKAI